MSVWHLSGIILLWIEVVDFQFWIILHKTEQQYYNNSLSILQIRIGTDGSNPEDVHQLIKQEEPLRRLGILIKEFRQHSTFGDC